MIYDPHSTEVNSDADVLEHPVNDTSEQMPLSLLPEPFKQMSEAISHSARVPQSLAGCCVLGALSASIGSGLRVRSGADRFTHANLYIMASATSGSGKSESFRLALNPFFTAEKEVIDHWKENVQSSVIADKMYVDARIDELKKQGADDIIVVVGGVIPKRDYDYLYKAGVKCIFGPGTKIPLAARDVLDAINKAFQF